MWHATAEPLVRMLQALEQEVAELDSWRDLLHAPRARQLDFGLLAHDAPVLARRLYVFAGPAKVDPPADGLLLGCRCAAKPHGW